MNAPHFYIAAVWSFVFLTFLFPASARSSSSAPASAVEVATANGLDRAQAESVVAKLCKAFGPRKKEQALIDEAAKMSKTDPRQAPAIAAVAATFVPEREFAGTMAAAVARTAKSKAPAIAAAVSAVLPGDAPKIAASVARAVPLMALRITRRVAYTVPKSVEGVSEPPRRSKGLESSVMVAVPAVRPSSVYGAAHFGARQAAREGRFSLN